MEVGEGGDYVWRWGKREIMYGGGGRGRLCMEVGEEGDYIPIATLSPPE